MDAALGCPDRDSGRSVDESERRVRIAVRTRFHPICECPERLLPLCCLRTLALHVAATDVYVHRPRVPVQAFLYQPLGLGRSGLDAALPFGLPSFLLGDPPAGALQVAQLHALEKAQESESRQAIIVHVFDSMAWRCPRTSGGAGGHGERQLAGLCPGSRVATGVQRDDLPLPDLAGQDPRIPNCTVPTWETTPQRSRPPFEADHASGEAPRPYVDHRCRRCHAASPPGPAVRPRSTGKSTATRNAAASFRTANPWIAFAEACQIRTAGTSTPGSSLSCRLHALASVVARLLGHRPATSPRRGGAFA